MKSDATEVPDGVLGVAGKQLVSGGTPMISIADSAIIHLSCRSQRGCTAAPAAERSGSMEFYDLDLAVAELQRVRDAAASASAQQRCFADCLRLRAATARALAAEIENLLS